MINQPTVLGFPITPWFITFFVCAVVILVGVVMLMRDIKNKEIKVDVDTVKGQLGVAVPDTSSVTLGSLGDKTEAMFGETEAVSANTEYVANVNETSSFYATNDATEAMFGATEGISTSNETASFYENKTEGFNFSETEAFVQTEAFSDKTESMN